jgi:hypothetical protein
MSTQLVKEHMIYKIQYVSAHVLFHQEFPASISQILLTIMAVADPSMLAELVGEIGVSPFGMS